MGNRRKLKLPRGAAPTINGVPVLTQGVDDRPGAKSTDGTIGPGRVNAWHCPVCDMYTVCIHVDAGVTPMFLACQVTKDCPGTAESIGYPSGDVPAGILKAVRWEWYRPSKIEFHALSAEMKDHVSRGGLVLREKAGWTGK